jgi:hypothetical protein
MYSVIRKYQFDAKNSAELDRQVRDGFVPIIKKAPGFLGYYWLNTGKGQAASISLFEDEAGAEESVRLAADFVQKNNLAAMIGKPEITKGPVKAHAVAMSLK